jgi:hypothetical protein
MAIKFIKMFFSNSLFEYLIIARTIIIIVRIKWVEESNLFNLIFFIGNNLIVNIRYI